VADAGCGSLGYAASQLAHLLESFARRFAERFVLIPAVATVGIHGDICRDQPIACEVDRFQKAL
jgi:hypothetical protein